MCSLFVQMNHSTSSPGFLDAASVAQREKYAAILTRVMDIGMALMDRLAAYTAAGDIRALKASVSMYEVLARSLRRNIMLVLKLDQPLPQQRPREAAASQGADAQKRQDVAEAPETPEMPETPEAPDRPDRPDPPDRLDRPDWLVTGSIDVAIGALCRDMGRVCVALGMPQEKRQLADLAAEAREAAVAAVLKEAPMAPPAPTGPDKLAALRSKGPARVMPRDHDDGAAARYGTSRFRGGAVLPGLPLPGQPRGPPSG